MSITTPVAIQPPLTPCIRTCRLDAHGYCVGCRRSGDEIAAWRTLPESEQRRYMDEVLPARGQP